MPSQTLPDAPPIAETAPSGIAPAEPTAARIIGLIGALLVTLGFAVIFSNEVFGPRLLTKTWGFVIIALGMLGLLMHAIRDGDSQMRRSYGLLAYILLLLTALLLIPNQANFLKYGWAATLLALCFLLAFSRHETDPEWRKAILWTLGGVGAILAGLGLIGGVTIQGFLLTYGLICAILGLAYLCAFMSQSHASGDVAHKTGLALGGVAIFAILYAVLRSTAPTLMKMNVPPFFVPTGMLLMFLGFIYGAVALGVVSDNRFVVLTRRELAGYFYSPIAYLVMFGMALMGFVAYALFVEVQLSVSRFEPIVAVYYSFFPPILVIFVVPAITMRLVAEEKRSGTYEVLMCAPVKETTVVLSKFVAALFFFMLLWGIWGLYLIALRAEAGKEFDYRPLISFYLALFFCGSGFISMGLFFSSLTKSQIIGAMLTFVGMLALLVTVMVQGLPGVGQLWQSVARHLSYSNLINESLQGRIHVRDMILQGSFSIFWLFLTVKVLEARRWS